MNHVYRLVWNPTLQALVAVCESARGRGKSGSSAKTTGALLASVLLSTGATLALAAGPAPNTLPTGAQVTAGTAAISSSANTLTVQQSSQKAAINWQSFSVGSNSTVNFVQPNASSVVLNRVVGNEQSVIAGAMNANGQVFLLNSNGVLFTGTASVNVGGLVASTLHLSDADFMAGRSTFSANGSKASVINLGTITAADGGYVALLGNQVKNEGVITARLGTAIMAAGDQISLNFNGDSLVGVTIDQGTLNALVENKQAIYADGGLVVLTAKGLDAVMATVVNNTGEIRAQTVGSREGKIYLLGGMENNRIEVGGTLDASAPNGGDGGFVETSAASVSVLSATHVTTNAPSGTSGTWLIDPTNFAIDAGSGGQTGSGIGVDTLRSNLGTSNVEIDVGTFTNYAGSPDQISFNSSLITNVDLGADRTLTLRVSGQIVFGSGVGIDATQGGNTRKLNLVLWTDQGTNNFGNASVTFSDTSVIKTNNGHLWIGGSPMSGNATSSWNGLTVGTGYASRSDISGPAVGIVLGSATIDTGSGDIRLWGQSGAFISGDSCFTNCEAITSTTGGLIRTTGSLTIEAATAGGGRVLNMGGRLEVGGATTVNFFDQSEGSSHGPSIQLDNPANILVNAPTVNSIDPAGFTYVVGPLPVYSTPIYLRLTDGGSSVYGSNPTFGYVFYDAASAGTAVTNATPSGSVVWSGAPTLSSNVGIYSLTYSSGITLGNSAYTLSPGSAVSWTVSRAPLTITASNASKVYGQIPNLSSFTSLGLVNSETIGSVNLTSAGTAMTAGVAAGPYAIVASAATGGSFAPGNYSISYVNGSLAVTPLVIAVAANDGATRVYDGSANAAASLLHVANAINGDTVTLSGNATLAGSNAGAEGVSSIAGLTLSNPNYTVEGGSASGSVAVSAAPLTVTASNASKVYGQTPALNGFTSSGLIEGETIGSVTETSSGTAVTAGVAAGPYAIVVSAATGGSFAPGNYSISYVNGALTVTPLVIMVAANNGATRVYDGTAAAAASLLNVANTINGDTVTLGGSATLAGSNAGTQALSGIGGLTISNPNYTTEGASASGSVAVSPAALTVTASNASKVYGQTPTLSGFTSSGLVNGETIGRVTETSSGTAVSAGVAAGPYAIVASAATGGTFAPGNYSISYVNGSLTVTPLVIAVAANDGATRIYSGSANAAASLLHVANAINGDTVTLSGNATLAGSNAGAEGVSSIAGLTLSNPNYTVEGASASGSVAVSPAALTVTASNASKVYGQTPALSGFVSSGLVGGQTIGSVTATSSGTAVTAAVIGSPYPIVASAATGGTFAPGNYSITYVNGSLTITPLAVNVAAVSGATRVYDGSANAAASLLHVSNAINGDTVTLSGEATLAAATAGTEALSSLAGLSLSNVNYTLVGGSANGSVTITAPASTLANTIANAINVPANAPSPGVDLPGVVLPAGGNSTNAGQPVAFVNVTNPLPAISAAFGTGDRLAVVSSPRSNEPTQAVTLSQARAMMQSPGQGSGGASDGDRDVRVPVSRNSLADIVNGGVRLPTGVEQELFVVQAN